MRTALYRHFDSTGRLLYVGVSLCALLRLSQHGDAPWFTAIKRVEIEHMQDRQSALVAERNAIAKENPLHNRKRPKEKPATVRVKRPKKIEHTAALELAIEQAGGATKLAEHIKKTTGKTITTQAISQWRRCPPLRVAQVSSAPGVKVKPKALCPELFPQ